MRSSSMPRSSQADICTRHFAGCILLTGVTIMATTEIIAGPKCLNCKKEMKPHDKVITVKSTLGKPMGWVCSRDCWHSFIGDHAKTLIKKTKRKPKGETCDGCGHYKKKDEKFCFGCQSIRYSMGWDKRPKPKMRTLEMIDILFTTYGAGGILDDVKMVLETMISDGEQMIERHQTGTTKLPVVKFNKLVDQVSKWERELERIEDINL